ncbi:MAG: exodeoxyribonuclease VII large subunit [Ferruginibacter sp.]
MSGIQHIKLSDLTRQIQKLINDHFFKKTYWVVGEISNLRYYPAKNYYFFDFVEKDADSNLVLTTVKTSAWSNAINSIKKFERITGQKFDNNIQVLLSVSVEYHITYGLKLNMLDVDPAFTLGNLEKQRQETLLKLVSANPGYIKLVDGEFITYNKSLLLNRVIQNIALIASESSDGYKDFKHELLNNEYHYVFTIDDYYTQVQGAGTEIQIINRLVEIFTSSKPYDAIVIVRGGGSQADFLIFDSYELARAIAKFPIPVFTGIGHTRNESIVDMMAFKATKTPTKVAGSILAHNRFFEEKILELQTAIISKTKGILASNNLSLSQLKATIDIRAKDLVHTFSLELSLFQSSIKELSLQRIYDSRQQIDTTILNLKNHVDRNMIKNRFKLESHKLLIKHLSPESILKRGYALIYQHGKIIIDPGKIEVGSSITTVLANTEIQSTITGKTILE